MELMQAALAAFSEKGFAATTIDAVAARAGVSKGTMYLYYPSKEALLEAVIRHYLSTPIASGAEGFSNHQGPMAQLLRDALVPTWLAILDSEASAVIKLVIAEVRNFPSIARVYASEVIEPVHRLIGTVIERGIATREFRRVDVADTVRSIVMPLVMLSIYKHSFHACAPSCVPPMNAIESRRFVVNHLDVILRGIAREPAAPRTTPATRPARAADARRPSSSTPKSASATVRRKPRP